MASTDWDMLTNSLDGAKVLKNVSLAFTPPAHSVANAFIYGFKTAVSNAGAVAMYPLVATGINVPTPSMPGGKGGRIHGAMKRYSASDKYSPFIGLVAGADILTATGYFLGLTQGANSYQIALKKGTLISGLQTSDAGILRVSTEAFDDIGDLDEAWHHLLLDVLVNPQGDVRLIIKKNDLATHDVDAPSWAAIDGMDDYVDDSLGILSGSVPVDGAFRFVYGMYTQGEADMSCLFDQVIAAEQLNP